jgi:hypothetical protein
MPLEVFFEVVTIHRELLYPVIRWSRNLGGARRVRLAAGGTEDVYEDCVDGVRRGIAGLGRAG